MNPTRTVTRRPIDVVELVERVRGPGRGGTAIFLGTVRRSPEDGPVTAIEYSGYEEMVEAEADRIVAVVRERWPDVAVVVQHRFGRLATGEASIAVVAAAPHRADAFAACRRVIEEAKNRLPVWKKEHFADGTEAWRQDTLSSSEC